MLPLGLKQSISCERLSNLEYQAFKLKKIYEKRSISGESVEVLKQALGLEFILPDDSIKSNLMLNLMPTYSDTSENSFEISTNCEVLIVVAMYNESSEHFRNTLNGINESLDEFKNNGVNPDKIACVVIVDGIKPFLEAYRKEKEFFTDYFDEEEVKRRFQVDNLENCTIPNKKKKQTWRIRALLYPKKEIWQLQNSTTNNILRQTL